MPVTIIIRDRPVSMDFEEGQNLSEVLRSAGLKMPSTCGDSKVCGHCRVRILEGEVSPPNTIEREQLTDAQIRDGLRLACQTRPLGDGRICLDYELVSARWHPLAAADESPFAPPSGTVAATSRASPAFGIAVDLGTTQLRLTLWDLRASRRVGALTGTNPQSVFGANILSRLAGAGESGRKAQDMAHLVQEALGEALAQVAEEAGIDLLQVRKLAVVGNTAMLSLFCGQHFEMLLQPDLWTREIICRLADGRELGRRWGLSQSARIILIQPLGGFVGSDLLANVLALRLTERPAGSLLVDFGTNTEIALWDGRALWVTSTPGGCAFVGPGTLPARAGAVFRVSSNEDASLRLDVIGGGPPQGVCGSGLVDFIAMLLGKGHVDRLGRFTFPVPRDGLPLAPELPGTSMRKRDIDSFQRGKGAMAAAMHFLLMRAGLRLKDVQQMFISGAFGQFLDIRNAQRVGLLPPVPPEQIVLAGDAALAGCEHLLLSRRALSALSAIRNCCILINLGDALEFEDMFIENLYLQPMAIEAP